MRSLLKTLPALLVGALVLSGCGPNLVERGLNPLSGGVCGLIWLILAALALSDLWKSGRTQGDKILWTVVIVVFPILGSVSYYLFGRKG